MIEINTCLKYLIFYPRWLPDIYWGYGSPIMTFYSPFFYYAVLPFYLLTQSYFVSFKLVIGLGVIASGILMYLFARHSWGKAGGILAAAAYMYAPYHIADIYVRGAFPEASLYVFFPALMLIVRKAVTSGKRSWAALLSLVFAISFLTHAMSLFFPFILVAYAILLTGRRGWKLVAPLATGFVLAAGMTAFYWIPAGLQKPFTHIIDKATGPYNLLDHFVYPFQLISPAWGWGDSLPGPVDGMSFQVGIAHIAFFILSLIAIPRLTTGQRMATIFSQAMVLISIFMMLPYSRPLWERLPFLGFLSFPWRLLFFTNFFTSLLAGAALCNFSQEKKGLKTSMAAIGVILVILLSSGYTRANYPNRIFRTEADCTRATVAREQLEFLRSQYLFLPIWVKQLPGQEPDNKVALQGEGKIEGLRVTPDSISFNYSIPRETLCSVGTFYYPSWKCAIDGAPHPIQPGDPTGQILVLLPPGRHRVILQFTNPPSVKLAQIISLASLVAAVIWLCRGSAGPRGKPPGAIPSRKGRT